MNVNRDTLEDQLQNHEAKLGELKSFAKELKAMSDRHGTESPQFEEDLFEAEHNVTFYEAEVARLRAEIGKLGDTPTPPRGDSGGGGGLPRVSKQGVGGLIIGLAAGALVALGLKSRRGGKD
jgi:hypothetical protein